MKEPNWTALFPEAPFRWHMGLRPAQAADFFGQTEGGGEVLAERTRWLTTHPREFAAALPESLPAVAEMVFCMSRWLGAPLLPSAGPHASEAEALTWAAGTQWEPDWVLLQPDAAGAHRLVAGVVCFPSLWSLREKIGRHVSAIHEPVVGLNDALGARIDTFLGRVKPGQDWERENWGFSPDVRLNRHPRFGPEFLTAESSLESTWIRLERQLFTRLPTTNALVFGIRVLHFRMADLAEDAALRRGMAVALDSMTDEVARYKGVDLARARLLAELRATS